jgi:APA family basic amino acid/polyamine antiporter
VFWASVLCLTGKYGDLLDFVVIIVLIFYILTILGIFILRKKCQMPKDHRAFGYPPAFYIVVATAIMLLYKLVRLVVIMLLGIRFII